jgi:AcrR family transcriptional regulator
VAKKRPVGEYAEGARRKAAIIKIASKLFAVNGYRDTSVASVASGAGLTLPGLLHHFRSKQELLFAVLGDKERRDKAVVAEAISAYPDDVAHLLEALVVHNAAARDDTALYSVLAAEATSPEHPAHDFFAARYKRVRDALRKSIAKQSAGTSLPDDEIRALATIAIATMDGLQIQWLIDPEIDMVAHFKVFSKLLQQAIGATAAR